MLRCASIWYGGKLNVTNHGQKPSQPVADVTFHQLDVIAIEHELDVRPVDLPDNGDSLFAGAQKIIGCIVFVQWFYQYGDAMGTGSIARILQIFDECGVRLRAC